MKVKSYPLATEETNMMIANQKPKPQGWNRLDSIHENVLCTCDGKTWYKMSGGLCPEFRGESWVNILRKDDAGKERKKLQWLSTYGNEMSGLGFLQFVPQPVKILVPSTDRIFWKVKLHPCTLQIRRMEQNEHKGLVAYLGRKEGKKLSLSNHAGQEDTFLPPEHQPKGINYQHKMMSPGPQGPGQKSRI